jgi:hypothetical protein
MKKIENWEEIETNEFIESDRLKLGGHICIIKNVKNYTYNGIDKVSLELDIAEGKQKDYYQKKYDERNENAKFWDDGATLSFVAEPKEDKDKSYIKGLIKAIESYNDGYTWDWDETKLKGKKIGVNFSLKEYQGSDGNVYTKPQVYRFVNSKENFREDYIPSVRTINNEYIKYEEYSKMTQEKNKDTAPFNNLLETDDDVDSFIL